MNENLLINCFLLFLIFNHLYIIHGKSSEKILKKEFFKGLSKTDEDLPEYN